MNMQKMLEIQKRLEENFDEDEFEKYFDDAGEYIDQKAEEGKRILLERIDEESFVRLMREVNNITLTSLNSQGGGGFLALANATGEIQIYTHTLFLTILAILIEEEVI